jgi:hypothetical protein
MENMGKLITLIIALALTGCASAPKSRDWNWVLIWNQAMTLADMERAAVIMERHDYVRVHEQVARNYVNPNLGSTPPADVEREMVYFRLANDYLYHWQKGDLKAAEKARVYARRLSEIPGLHAWSKFLIARAQEMDGGSYNHHYVPVPEGMGTWFFYLNSANDPNELNFGDNKAEYESILSSKQGGAVGVGTRSACFAVLFCLGALNSDEETVIKDLKRRVYLRVQDKQGRSVKIGASSWTEVAKSQ